MGFWTDDLTGLSDDSDAEGRFHLVLGSKEECIGCLVKSLHVRGLLVEGEAAQVRHVGQLIQQGFRLGDKEHLRVRLDHAAAQNVLCVAVCHIDLTLHTERLVAEQVLIGASNFEAVPASKEVTRVLARPGRLPRLSGVVPLTLVSLGLATTDSDRGSELVQVLTRAFATLYVLAISTEFAHLFVALVRLWLMRLVGLTLGLELLLTRMLLLLRGLHSSPGNVARWVLESAFRVCAPTWFRRKVADSGLAAPEAASPASTPPSEATASGCICG